MLITFVLNIIVQLWREARQRRWQLEDAAQKKRELDEHERHVKAALEDQTRELQKSMRTRVTDLSTRFDELLDEAESRREDNGS